MEYSLAWRPVLLNPQPQASGRRQQRLLHDLHLLYWNYDCVHNLFQPGTHALRPL